MTCDLRIQLLMENNKNQILLTNFLSSCNIKYSVFNVCYGLEPFECFNLFEISI